MIELDYTCEGFLSILIMIAGDNTLIADTHPDDSIHWLIREGLIERATCEGLEAECYMLSGKGKTFSAAIREAGITISANQ